jgi:hypothetical protein
MKKRLTLLLVLVVAAGSLLAFRSTMTTDTAVEGVWKSVHVTSAEQDFDTTQPSILFFTAGHYASVGVRGTEPRETFPEEPTDEQRLAAWSRFFASAGTYEVSGNEIHTNVIVDRNPNLTAEQAEGSSTFEVDGDTMVRTFSNGVVVTYTRIE